MRKIILVFLLNTCIFTLYTYASIPDSLMQRISQTQGASKIMLLHKLYLKNCGNSSAFDYIDMLRQEAVKQRNKKLEMRTMGMRIQAFLNANQSDSVIKYAPGTIDFVRLNGDYKLMFTIQDLLVSQLMLKKEFIEALRIINEQYKEAKKLNNPIGLAIANKNMGLVYRFTGRSTEAWKFYKESMEWLKKANEKSLMIDLYLDLISINREQGERLKALDNCNRCYLLIKEKNEGAKKYPEVNTLSAQYFTYLCLKACVCTELDRMKEAEKCIHSAIKATDPA